MNILIEFYRDLHITQAALLVQLLNIHECINQVQAGLILCQGYVPEKHHANQKIPI